MKAKIFKCFLTFGVGITVVMGASPAQASSLTQEQFNALATPSATAVANEGRVISTTVPITLAERQRILQKVQATLNPGKDIDASSSAIKAITGGANVQAGVTTAQANLKPGDTLVGRTTTIKGITGGATILDGVMAVHDLLTDTVGGDLETIADDLKDRTGSHTVTENVTAVHDALTDGVGDLETIAGDLKTLTGIHSVRENVMGVREVLAGVGNTDPLNVVASNLKTMVAPIGPFNVLWVLTTANTWLGPTHSLMESAAFVQAVAGPNNAYDDLRDAQAMLFSKINAAFPGATNSDDSLLTLVTFLATKTIS